MVNALPAVFFDLAITLKEKFAGMIIPNIASLSCMTSAICLSVKSSFIDDTLNMPMLSIAVISCLLACPVSLLQIIIRSLFLLTN